MRESSAGMPSQQSRERLRRRRVPDLLLGKTSNDGLNPAYVRYWHKGLLLIGLHYNPAHTDNQLWEPGAGREIRRLLSPIPTYTEDCEQRITVYNETAPEHQQTAVDADKTLALLTTAHPAIETLDALTRSVRRFAALPVDPQELVQRFVTSASSVDGIFWGEGAYRRRLAEYGLAETTA